MPTPLVYDPSNPIIRKAYLEDGLPWKEASPLAWPGVDPKRTHSCMKALKRERKDDKVVCGISLVTDDKPSLISPKHTPYAVRSPREVEVERTLFLNDTHFPFQDKKVIRAVLDFTAYFKPSRIYLNGDIADCYAISSFDKDPKRTLMFQQEVDETVEFLQDVLDASDSADTVYIEGNHESRIFRMLMRNPELSSMRSMHPRVLYRLEELGIRWVGAMETEMWHGVLVTHGTKISKWSGYTAKQEYDSYGVSGISGHVHRASTYRHRDQTGEHIWIENGCLCDLNPPYMRNPNWQHAITVGEFVKFGDRFQLSQINIPNGKLLWDGKVFG